MSERAPRPTPPSFMEKPEEIGDRMQKIREEEGRLPTPVSGDDLMKGAGIAYLDDGFYAVG